MDGDDDEALRQAEELVAYFQGLPAAAREEFAALAARDRRFGEDVGAERAERSPEKPR